jgi:hypothetical protein
MVTAVAGVIFESWISNVRSFIKGTWLISLCASWAAASHTTAWSAKDPVAGNENKTVSGPVIVDASLPVLVLLPQEPCANAAARTTYNTLAFPLTLGLPMVSIPFRL